MYRATYPTLLEVLKKGGCENALAELKDRDLPSELITAVEVDFEIEDKGTEDEILTVTEFNIYLGDHTVIFGYQLKHEADFTITWARTKPSANRTILGQKLIELPDLPPKTKENLDFLLELALDACEYRETSEEKHSGYTECDEAYAVVAETFKDLSKRLNLARGKVGDLSRVVEKQCGDAEADDEINKRIDEIYTILKGE